MSLNICLNAIYYYNFWGLFLKSYISGYESHITVLLLDTILLLRSLSIGVLLTFATKSFAIIVKAIIPNYGKHYNTEGTDLIKLKSI